MVKTFSSFLLLTVITVLLLLVDLGEKYVESDILDDFAKEREDEGSTVPLSKRREYNLDFLRAGHLELCPEEF